ncbi:MAG: VWA-like domain-containing protein [Lachnospiraceae bacterium]|nr:VWA-like domain-containing protein [Lachnospiraceae bacterium]
MDMKDERNKKISALAGDILGLVHDDILVHLRFFDVALMKLELRESKDSLCMATDGRNIYYNPVYILRLYKSAPELVERTYLHIVLHCIFSHNFQYNRLDGELWDMAADIAVENVIIGMKLSGAALESDYDAERRLRVLKEASGELTAERIYKYFRNNPPTEGEKDELKALFYRDVHTLWKPAEQTEITAEQWRKLSERIKADLKSFTRAKAGADTLERNLEEATRERYDYAGILRKFAVMGENIKVNDDEFDYVYYTYGLVHYGNLPLIEPLEYKEENKVREFVIAIDTSASCRGQVVKAFLQKTYSILKTSESFFNKINVHIIQCDTEVQNDTKITCDEDFERFIKHGRLTGFGATDFRPVFSYVERLRAEGEFERLRGLIYFTDGYGIYPEKMPDYDVIFAFLNEDENRAPVPPWSMKVIIEEEE